jgi:hypothetical protein
MTNQQNPKQENMHTILYNQDMPQATKHLYDTDTTKPT